MSPQNPTGFGYGGMEQRTAYSGSGIESGIPLLVDSGDYGFGGKVDDLKLMW
jgi:hypothetical protein